LALGAECTHSSIDFDAGAIPERALAATQGADSPHNPRNQELGGPRTPFHALTIN
jgi:hypothetical protein